MHLEYNIHSTCLDFRLVDSEIQHSNPPSQLSATDLSRYRGSFTQLQKTASKLYLSSVVTPLAAIEQLSASASDVQHLTAEQAIAADRLSASSFIYVELSVARDGETREQLLARHDAEIAAIQAKPSSATRTLFVYTGRSSSAASPTVRSRQVRQAVPVADNATHFINDRMMIYFTNLTYNDEIIKIASMSATLENATNVVVTLTGAVATDVLKFTVTTDVLNWWQVQDVVFRDVSLFVRDQQVGALPGFSYHCAPALEFRTLNGSRSPLQLKGLQLEADFTPVGPLFVQRTNFSEPWDCVGFVSPGMLGGFFVTLLMLVIVTIGITWIMDIRTMDRFDDPKGKAIVVATSE